jgi:hypothetical protein
VYTLDIVVKFDLSGTEAENNANVEKALLEARDVVLFGATSVRIGAIVWQTSGMWRSYRVADVSPNGIGLDYDRFADAVDETLAFMAQTHLSATGYKWVTQWTVDVWHNPNFKASVV